MKTILTCLLVLAVSMPLCNADCFLQPLTAGPSDGCYDSKGQLHEFGSRWRSESCYDCDCSREGISCCSSFPTPVDYDKEKCVSIFYKESCMYKVVQKDDDSKECPVHGWVA